VGTAGVGSSTPAAGVEAPGSGYTEQELQELDDMDAAVLAMMLEQPDSVEQEGAGTE